MECSICRRSVVGTCHTRTGYVIDHYKLHTGITEAAVIKNQNKDDDGKHFEKLVQAIHVVLCLQCSQKKDISESIRHFHVPPGIEFGQNNK